MRLRAPILVTLLLAAVASAQMPAPGVQAPPTPVLPDTAVARFSWRGDGPVPRALAVSPGPARFGDVVTLMVDLPPGADMLPVDSLEVDVDWLEPASAAEASEPAGMSPATGLRLLAPFRVYRLGPWRPAWGDGPPGPVQGVAGRLEAGQSFVPVRDPRLLGGLPVWVLVLVGTLVLATLTLLVWWRLRGRPSRAEAADRPLPPPAWLQAAMDLWTLEESHGHDRAYLDALAAVLRRYLLGRFHLPAAEMTASEIAVAARRAGWPTARLGAFAGILAGCDEARYAPTDISAQQCRDGMRRLLDLIDAERVEPVWTFVPPASRAAAVKAWSRLRQRYPAGHKERAPC